MHPWLLGVRGLHPGPPITDAWRTLVLQGSDPAFVVTVQHLVFLALVLAIVATAATAWLAAVGYRAYRRRGTRVVALAATGLGLIALSRLAGLAAGWYYAADDPLTVPDLLAVQILRSSMLVVGFALIVYALLART